MIFDLTVFSFINGFAGKWPVLDAFGFFCAEYLGDILLGVLILLLILNCKKNWKMVVEALAAALIVLSGIVQLMHTIYFRARPFVRNPINVLLPYDPRQASFPSAHASFYFALSTIVFLYNKKLGTAFLIASLFISIGRVFVGVHWPLDVIAGALLGAGTAWLIHVLLRRAYGRG